MNARRSAILKKLTYSAVCLAIAMLLPLLTGQIPQVGNALCPMHIPVFLCGFICGWPWGAVVGFISPLLRYLIFGMPPIFPQGISMAFELAAYGAIAGMMYKLLPKKIPYIYVSLISAMVVGRLVWGAVNFVIAGLGSTAFPFSAFFAGAVGNAVPGIILHIVLIPPIIIALRKAKLILNQ
ncbi:MAG: ECF transporter S component [Eubacteriales bacterium]|nr:ECF transporter S component [Eubacteriales bacterium]